MFSLRMPPVRGVYTSCLLLLSFLAASCGRDHPTAPSANLAPSAAPALSPESFVSQRFSDERAETSEPRDANWREIDSPTVITRPGFYRVTKSFSVDAATANGIVIRSDRVVLSLGRHEIRGPGHKLGIGIAVQNAHHVWIWGGRLSTFGVGVLLEGSSRVGVSGVHVTGGDETADPANGNPPQIGFLLINSPRNRIAWNVARDVNLGLFVRGSGSVENRIRDNQITAGRNGLLGICYNPAAGAGPEGPARDDVFGNVLARFGTGIQASSGSTENRFRRNVIRYFDEAYRDFNGSNVFERNETVQIAR